MKQQLNMVKIAKILGAERQGKISATSGYFGAIQLISEVERRFRIPKGGGRATNPGWTERRLINLSRSTLDRVREFAGKISAMKQVHIEPMQVAALILERAIQQIPEHELEELTKDQIGVKSFGRLFRNRGVYRKLDEGIGSASIKDTGRAKRAEKLDKG
ncbi:MAG: hypothetical protein HYU64_05830 [Armatimonadetes bacterium]|nr:hypothetical protein [Armatimonadota bacterium]